MDFFRKLALQLQQIWSGMSRVQQVSVVMAAVLGLAAISVVAYFGMQTDYQTLYSGLAPEDAGEVVAKLKTQGIPYQLGSGGTTILVPSDQISQVRIEMSSAGLPAKGDGYGILSSGNFNMNPRLTDINILRALQGELAKSIEKIDPVVAARVHIVRPEPSPFIRDQKPATASVMLKLKPGATLSRNVGATIATFVSRAVEGLAKENVTLLDTNGRMLWDERRDSDGNLSSSMDTGRDLEKRLAENAESMLAQVLGPGRAVVRVTAEIDNKRHSETIEKVNPETKLILKEKTQSSSSQNGSSTKGAAAGTSTNLGKGGVGLGSGGGSNTKEETSEVESYFPKTLIKIDHAVGAIERLTIAALVDLSKRGEDSSDTEPIMKLEDVQDIIQKAVGYKQGRDEIKVSQVKIPDANNSTTFLEEWQAQEQWRRTLSIVRNSSLGMMAVVGLILGFLILRNLSKAIAKPEEDTSGPEEYITMARIATAIERDPEVMTRVMNSWLKDEQKQQPARAA